MFRRILVPLDRSAVAECALPHAIELAKAAKGEIRLVLVHQPLPFAGFSDAPWYGQEADAEREYLQTIAGEIAWSDVKVTFSVVQGDPVDRICHEAHESRAELILMSTHGRSGLSRAWIGSITQGVVRRSPVPVMAVRPGEAETVHDGRQASISRILVPLDGSAFGDKVVSEAAALAAQTGASLTLLEIVEPVPWISPVTNIPYAYSPPICDEELTPHLVSSAKAHLARHAEKLKRRVAGVETFVLVNNRVAPTIIEFAQTHRIDAIAMSTHGRGLSRLLLGSVADKVLRSVDIPVMLLRPARIGSNGMRRTATQRAA